VNQIKDLDSGLAEEISKEVAALSNRREFGLNFERHTPEQVELPGRQVRKGDKVHLLAPRGETPKTSCWFPLKYQNHRKAIRDYSTVHLQTRNLR
jgi:adenine-specific DNA-methyltransferase